MRQLVTDAFEVIGLVLLAAAAAFAAAQVFPVATACAAGGGALIVESAVLERMTRPAPAADDTEAR